MQSKVSLYIMKNFVGYVVFSVFLLLFYKISHTIISMNFCKRPIFVAEEIFIFLTLLYTQHSTSAQAKSYYEQNVLQKKIFNIN